MSKNKNVASIFSKNDSLNLAATLLLSLLLSANAAAQSPIMPPGLERIDARVSIHSETGKVRFIGTSLDRLIELPPGIAPPQSAEAAARAFGREYGPLFGIENPAQELRLTRERAISGGREKAHFQQMYRGVPVIAGELIVNLGPGRKLLSMSGEISPELSLSTAAGISALQAQDTAVEAVAKWYQVDSANLTAEPASKAIYDPRLLGQSSQSPSLVWQLEVVASEPQIIKEYILIDAQTGAISLHYSQIKDARNRETYTSNETTTTPGTLVCNESDPTCAAGDVDAQDAHIYAGDTYDFYFTNHGRDAIDGVGGTMVSSTHYNNGECPNAYWTGVQMLYCTGMAADDVVGHELTHGVTENESNLVYLNQSGAINESLSDVWGEFVDLSNTGGTDTAGTRWQMGEDLPSSIGIIRNLQDPTIYNDPDRMSSALFYTGAADSGGVHTNSGVNNKAAYLMTDGDTFNGFTITGLGITKVATVYYEAQTNLLTSGSDYGALYDALNQACQNVIGTAGITSADCTEVEEATLAVEMNQLPGGGFSTTTQCPAGTTIDSVAFSDDMESSTSWTFSTLSGANAWAYSTVFATSGTTSLYAPDINTTSDAVAAMTTSVIVPASGYLHFQHSFSFEGGSWDGGVLEYSTDGGLTWIDPDALHDAGIGYNGTIKAGSNPLGGRIAFVNDSGGTVSSRYDLSSLAAGSAVQFRFRIGTDESVAGPFGWAVDDVQVYNCAVPAPDLITINPSVSESAPYAGQNFTASATVQNQGGADSASTSLRYYQSADSVISTTDTEIATDTIPILAAAGTSPQSALVAAPAAPGTYWIGACVDAVADESNTTNQCSAGVEITVLDSTATQCPSGTTVDSVAFVDNMESSTAWTFSTLSGTNAWLYDTTSPISGTTSLYAPDIATTSDAVAEMTNAVTVPINGYLHFQHSFSLEPSWDGGVLEYSTDGGLTWIDPDALHDAGIGYNGTINAGTNPLGGRIAFVNDSGGTVSSRYDLSSFAGSPVQFRFRIGTDSSVSGPFGWAVDDVQVYNCAVPAPDLVTINPGVSEAFLVIGQSFTASAFVQNLGLVASASTTLRYFQSTDSTISTTDVEIASDAINSLLAGATSLQSTVAITAPATPGTYWIGACVDVVTDESMTNNQCSIGVQITVPFNDVPTSHWASDSVQLLTNEGIASGCGDGNFCPDQMATRSLVALWLGNAFALTEVASPGSKYLDVADTDLNAGWIEAFGNAGISEGCNSDGTLFCPDQSVSRASLALLLLRAKFGSAYLPTAFSGLFSDVLVGDFGAVFIEDLFTKGITDGCSTTQFCPSHQVTAAELAILLARTITSPP